jgi:hypothetical protein
LNLPNTLHFSKNNNFLISVFWQNFPAKKKLLPMSLKNFPKSPLQEMKKQIYLQIGIMGWNDGTGMKERIIEPNFIPSLREKSAPPFSPFFPSPTFFLSHSKGALATTSRPTPPPFKC